MRKSIIPVIKSEKLCGQTVPRSNCSGWWAGVRVTCWILKLLIVTDGFFQSGHKYKNTSLLCFFVWNLCFHMNEYTTNWLTKVRTVRTVPVYFALLLQIIALAPVSSALSHHFEHVVTFLGQSYIFHHPPFAHLLVHRLGHCEFTLICQTSGTSKNQIILFKIMKPMWWGISNLSFTGTMLGNEERPRRVVCLKILALNMPLGVYTPWAQRKHCYP